MFRYTIRHLHRNKERGNESEKPKQLLEEIDPENGDQSSGTDSKVAAATFGEEQRLNTLKGMLNNFYMFALAVIIIVLIAARILHHETFVIFYRTIFILSVAIIGLCTLMYVEASVLLRSAILALPFDAGCPRNPLFVDLYEDCGAESKQRLLAGEDPDDRGPSLQLLLHGPLHRVRGSHRDAVPVGQVEDGEALRNAALEPLGEGGMRVRAAFDQLVQGRLGPGCVPGVPHGPELGPDPVADLRRSLVEGVLGEMELAALPLRAREDRPAGGPQPGMVVGGDELDAAQAAGDEAVEEVAPVDLCLRQLDGDAQNAPLPVGLDADGSEDGDVAHDAAVAHLLVAGVELKVPRLSQRPLPPPFEFHVHFLRGAADLRRGNALDPHLGQKSLDPAGRDAADVHLGDREHQRALAAHPLLEARRVEGLPVELAALGRLGHAEVQGPRSGVEALALEAVGVALAALGAFVRTRLEMPLAFDQHGRVEHRLEKGLHGRLAFGHAVVGLFRGVPHGGVRLHQLLHCNLDCATDFPVHLSSPWSCLGFGSGQPLSAALVVARQRHMPPQSRSVVSGLHARFLLNNAALDRKGRDHGRRRRGAAPGSLRSGAGAPLGGGSGWCMPGRIYIHGGTPPTATPPCTVGSANEKVLPNCKACRPD